MMYYYIYINSSFKYRIHHQEFIIFNQEFIIFSKEFINFNTNSLPSLAVGSPV